MQLQALDLAETEAIRRILEDPLATSALEKICAKREQAYTEDARNQLNVIPENLHEKAKKETLASQYAAMAKAWRDVMGEIEQAVS